MAEDAVTILLEKVKEFRIWHKNLVCSGSENEQFQKLSEDLLLLKAFFKDATNRLEIPQVLRSETEWRIRDVVYDIEDAIDSALFKAEAKSRSTIRRHVGLYRFSLAKEVTSLRKHRLKPMFESVKQDFVGLSEAQGSRTSTEQPALTLEKVNYLSFS